MIYFENQYATVWEVEDKGKYTQVKFSTSRKDKQHEGKYLNSNWSYTRFVGKAHEAASSLSERDRITIIKGGLSWEPYEDENGERKWAKNPQIVVFDFKYSDSEKSNGGNVGRMDNPPHVESDIDESEIPF